MSRSYQQHLDWLYSTQQFGIKLGLGNVTRLLNELGLPKRLDGIKIQHVAGTNGKGSVCAFTEQILRDGGLKTGLFTSPHLIAFPERIRVNGVPASESSLAEALGQIRELVEAWDPHPTFFEITLVAALVHFCQENCEVLILETGMGGRLDATNALKADISVITQIALDHQQWLGDDLRSIAAEKAGILKPEVPVVVADVCSEARDVIGRTALKLGIPYIEAHPLAEDWPLGLAGAHQRENAALAVEAACRLEQDNLTLDGIRQSLANTRWPGRFQRLGDNDEIILDGAHNEAAARSLAATWVEEYGQEKATLVFGAAQTKAVAEIFSQLMPIVDHVLLVPIRSVRRLTADEMSQHLDPSIASTACDSLANALDRADQLPGKTLVAGSLFLVGETLSILAGDQGFEVSLQ